MRVLIRERHGAREFDMDSYCGEKSVTWNQNQGAWEVESQFSTKLLDVLWHLGSGRNLVPLHAIRQEALRLAPRDWQVPDIGDPCDVKVLRRISPVFRGEVGEPLKNGSVIIFEGDPVMQVCHTALFYVLDDVLAHGWRYHAKVLTGITPK